eukprot:9839951-Heterocapsa_arctica.AAC.1
MPSHSSRSRRCCRASSSPGQSPVAGHQHTFERLFEGAGRGPARRSCCQYSIGSMAELQRGP